MSVCRRELGVRSPPQPPTILTVEMSVEMSLLVWKAANSMYVIQRGFSCCYWWLCLPCWSDDASSCLSDDWCWSRSSCDDGGALNSSEPPGCCWVTTRNPATDWGILLACCCCFLGNDWDGTVVDTYGYCDQVITVYSISITANNNWGLASTQWYDKLWHYLSATYFYRTVLLFN